MKGIILAGGSGTRLHPMTYAVSKQILPIYDKPMIYYPLSVLMMSGINEILIISTPMDLPIYQELLKDGEQLGLSFSYKIQETPNGLAQAFILGEEFIGDENVCLILGDTVFYGAELPKRLKKSVEEVKKIKNAILFGYFVNDPERYGVVEFDLNGQPISFFVQGKEGGWKNTLEKKVIVEIETEFRKEMQELGYLASTGSL